MAAASPAKPSGHGPVILVIVVSLFPPWTKTFTDDGIDSAIPLGHASLLKPPTDGLNYPVEGVGIDGVRLAVMLGGIFIITGGVIVSMRSKSPTQSDPSAQHNGHTQEHRPPSKKRRGSFAHPGFWLLIATGVTIHVIVACGIEATRDQYIEQITYGFIMVFMFGCVGCYTVGVFSQDHEVQLAGCIVGIALAITTTLYLNSSSLPNAASSSTTSTAVVPNASEPDRSTDPPWKNDPVVGRWTDGSRPPR